MPSIHRPPARVRGASCALACLCLPVAFAQSPAPSALSSVVVTASRLPLTRAEVLADVVVIDQAAIDRSAALPLTELLRQHAGVEIAANGGPGQFSSVFVRGSNANHVVVLVDGVRLSAATAGTTAFENLPLAQIERIEVLRGPGSSLYGADAIGGVIQIFTKQHERREARVGAGSWRTGELTAGLGQRMGDWMLSLQAGLLGSRSFSATTADNASSFDPDRDPYRNRSLGLGLSRTVASGHSVALRVLGSDGRTDYDAFGGADATAHQRLSTVALESRNRWSEGWQSTLRIAQGADRRRDETAFPFYFDTRQDQLVWQHDLSLAGGMLAAGLDWRQERIDSDTVFDRDRRRVAALFASHAARLGDHTFQASLRRDQDSQFGGRSTGGLAWGLQLAPDWRVSASAGTAFKAPTFNDLYFPGFSNPQLRPETSRNLEAALRYDDDGVEASAVIFDNRIRDLIQFDAVRSIPVNVARARIRGLTLGAGWRADDWRMRGEWTHQAPENRDTGQRLVRRAADHGTASLAWEPGPWQAGLDLVATGARYDNGSGATRPRLGGYALVHLHAAWQAAPAWTVSLRLNNAADRDHRFVSGYQTPGRQVFVALQYAQR